MPKVAWEPSSNEYFGVRSLDGRLSLGVRDPGLFLGRLLHFLRPTASQDLAVNSFRNVLHQSSRIVVTGSSTDTRAQNPPRKPRVGGANGNL